MKKIIIIIYLVLIVSISGVMVYANSKSITSKFYTIRENYSYVYENDRKMTFNVYSTSNDTMIMYPEYNSYTLRLDKLSHTLENVKVDVLESNEINVIKITCDMPKLTDSELVSSTCKLDIINGEYSLLLDMGTFTMLDSKYYPNIVIDGLSGSYSSINGYINLVGINITLNGEYEYMNEFRLGYFTSGIISKTKSKVSYGNEIAIYDIMPDYVETRIDNNYTYGVKDKMMFIPMGYRMSYLSRSGYLIMSFDNKYYYFDNFPFMATDPIFNNYKNYLTEGVIYA